MAIEVGQPQHWEKRVLAAYLLLMGDTQERIACQVGRSRQTLLNWRNDPSWPAAKAEAERRWLYDLKDDARRAVQSQIRGGDGDLGLKVLERTTDEFAPKQKHEGISPQVVQVLVQKILVYLTDDQAHELLDFVAAQLSSASAPRLAASNGATNGH